MLAESRIGIPLADLAMQFEVSDRSIRRGLAVLQTASSAIQEFVGDRGVASDYSKRAEMIDQLMLAIEDRLISLVDYQSDQATEPVEQEVYLEIKRWIMSFGPSATVLEPPELADEIHDDLTRMLKAYADSPA